MSDVLGMNARNLLFIRRENKRGAIRIADSKAKTKAVLARYDIPTIPLLKKIRTYREIKKLEFLSLPEKFVVKPDRGLAGGGILVINEVKESDKGPLFIDSSGKEWKEKELKNHIRDILDGNFSISGTPDIAIIEEKAVLNPELKKYSPVGIPDIRMIVYNKVPVMAMMRVPTKKSHGKANMKLGAIGVGIDIATGKTTTAEVQKPKRGVVLKHPETKKPLKGFQIPQWNDILEMSVKAQEASGLGYLGVDVVIEKEKGPVIFELNARPGLEIQNVNQSGLEKRLERVQGLKVENTKKGIRIAKELFGDIVEKQVENLSGKEVIGLSETISLIGKSKKKVKVMARVDTSSPLSSVTPEIANKIGIPEKEKTAEIEMLIEEEKFKTKVRIEEHKKSKFPIWIGQKDLQRFIIDPSKKEIEAFKTEKTTLYKTLDNKIVEAFKEINIIKAVTPLNLEEQRKLFFEGEIESPVFEYEAPSNLLDLKLEKLRALKSDTSALGTLFAETRDEQIRKLELAKSIGKDEFSEKSKELYGSPSQELLEHAKKNYKRKKTKQAAKKFIYGEEVMDEVKKFLKKHSVPNRIAMVDELGSRIAITVSEHSALISIRKNSKFTKEELRGTIAHEIETHLYRSLNANKQKYKIFSVGVGKYKDTEEGLATLNKDEVYKNPRKFDTKCLFVLAIKYALSHSFAETFGYLKSLGVGDKTAWNITYKTKRGIKDTSKPGAFTKDLVYLRGYLKMKEIWQDKEKLKSLYVGRIGVESLELIDKLNFVMPPKYLPESLTKTK